MGPATINRKYRHRILRLLRVIREQLIRQGFAVDEPQDTSCGQFCYSLFVHRPSCVDISFNIYESEEWDGEKGGINFGISVTEEGGLILGDFIPSNYTSEVWVNRQDAEAIERRFCIVENSAGTCSDDNFGPLLRPHTLPEEAEVADVFVTAMNKGKLCD